MKIDVRKTNEGSWRYLITDEDDDIVDSYTGFNTAKQAHDAAIYALENDIGTD